MAQLTQAFVNEFADDVLDAMDSIHKDSFSQVMEDSNKTESQGGRLPFKTGALQDSIDVNGATGVDGWQNGVRSAPVGGTLEGGYRASYAGFLEFGTSSISPRAFMRGAAVKWDEFVRVNAEAVK